MLLCALGGHAFVLASAVLGLGAAPVVGFSGVVFGVVAAFALTYPEREIWFFFFRMRALHLLYISIGIQLLGALSFSNVSAAAHFGGMAAGAAFAATRSGPLRRWWLQRKLAKLQAEAEELRGEKPAGRRRIGGPDLRVIQGGADRPKDKRYLN
jgi:membrane associated rhomboid family serine protease